MTGTDWVGIQCRLHSMVLPNAPVPPLPRVRAWVADLLDDLPTDVAEDAQLVVTELVANAYEHGRGPRELRVERRDHTGRLMIEVDDRGCELPVLGHSRLGDNRGRGIRIVAGLSLEWGVQRHGAGKTVWAVLAA